MFKKIIVKIFCFIISLEFCLRCASHILLSLAFFLLAAAWGYFLEELYCKRPIQCLASSEILTPTGYTLAGWRGWRVNSSEDATHCSVLYICKYFVGYFKMKIRAGCSVFNRVTSKTTLLKITFPLQRDDIRLGQNKSRIEPHLFTFFSGKKIFSCHRDCTADVFNSDMLAAKPDGGSTMRPL